MDKVLLNLNTGKGRIIRRIISCLLVAAIFATSLSFDAFSKKTEAAGGYGAICVENSLPK